MNQSDEDKSDEDRPMDLDRLNIDSATDSSSPEKPQPTRFAPTYNLMKKKPDENTKYSPRRYARYSRNPHKFQPKLESSPRFEPICSRRLFK